MRKFKHFLFSAIIVFILTNVGLGQALLTEDFDYDAGQLITANGWTAHSGGTTLPITVTAPGLTYSGFAGSGIGNAVTISGSGQDDNKSFTAQTTGSVYMSFMVNITGASTTGDYFIHLLTGTTSFYGRLYVKKDASNNLAFAINRGSVTTATTYTDFSYAMNTTYLMVIKYTFVSGAANDIATLFINPVINGTEPSPTLTNTDVTSADATTIDKAALRQGSNTPTAVIDGIRVGTAWNDVVPVTSSPSISTTGTLTPFSTTVGTPSASQTYTVSATNLTEDLIITPPTGYQVRENGIGVFGSSLSFTPVSGTVSIKTIEVRFNPAGVGTYIGNVTNASTGASTQNVAVTGAANAIYYNMAGSNLDVTTNWGTEPDGSGSNPSDFVSDNQTFIAQNGSAATIGSDWIVAGNSSKVVLGDGINSINFTIPSSFFLIGIIDLSANSTITVQNNTLPTWGTLNSASTIDFAQSGPFTIPASTYPNLKLTGGTKTFSGNNTTVTGNLTFDNAVISAPGASPFASIYLGGNLTYSGTVTPPADANSITLICTKNGTQTITGNGNTVRFFRLQTTGTGTNVILSTTGGSSNLLLGNSAGGGLSLGTGTNLTINSNTFEFLSGSKCTFLGTGTLSCDGTSNIILNSVQTTTLGTMYFSAVDNAVNNLTINEIATSNFTLGSSLIINGTLTLTSGSLATGSFTLFFGTSAVNPVETSGKTIIGTAVMNARSVGTGSIDFFSSNIASGIDNLGNVIITRKTGTAGVITVGSFTSIACNWTITADNQPTNGRDVTYSWLSDFDNGKVFAATNKGQVWVSDDAITWTTSGLPVDVSASDPRSITNNTTHFSYWVVSPEDSPMPVALSSFNSNITGRNVKLSWVTETELNNAGFEVERAEVGSQKSEFSKIGYIQGNGTKNTSTSYSFEDKNLNTGKYKYRLKQIDHNGNYEYFELNGEVEVGVPKKFDLSQNYPNPFNPVTKINFDLPENGLVNIRLYDMLGREVAVIVNEVRNAGYHTVQFDASKLSSGIYFYRMNAGKFNGIKKMAVIK
ncbi:MAG: T9SS type A sorting domain-containing protein [Candidatus Kapaibacterium sp.]